MSSFTPLTLRTHGVRTLIAIAVLVAVSIGINAFSRAARGAPDVDPKKDGVDDNLPVLALHKIGRGDVIVTINERGAIEAVQNTPIYWKGRDNTVIKLVVDDGTMLKKGDRVAVLDDSALVDQLRVLETVAAEKKSLLEQAVKDKELAAQLGKLEVETAEDNVEVAEIDLKQAAEKDRPKMEVRLRQAKRAAQLARIQAATREEKAVAAVTPCKVALDAELAKLADLKEQIATCVLTAPHSGMVVYIPELARFGAHSSIVAVGEPMRKGQKLMTIAILERFQVMTKVQEAVVFRLQPRDDNKADGAQQAKIVVDAFPDKALKGLVQAVATVASQTDFLSSDVKLFAVKIVLDADQRVAGLKPGMSAAITIVLAEKKNVLRAPVQAVLAVRNDKFCYVKTAAGVERRRVVLGESNDSYVEVKEGLKEGEQIVLNPRDVRDARNKITNRERGWKGGEILVRSVRPADDGDRLRAFVERFGLTFADLTRINETVPNLALVVPARIFPGELRNSLNGRMDLARVVATTPDEATIFRLNSRLVDEDHRFLADQDQERSAAVAVLGARVARKLFPLDDPLHQTILVSGRLFRVVGVLRDDLGSADINHDDVVYIPLSASQRLFGKKFAVRSSGRRRIEEVELSEVRLLTRDREQVPTAAVAVRGILEHGHDKQDWQIEIGAR